MKKLALAAVAVTGVCIVGTGAWKPNDELVVRKLVIAEPGEGGARITLEIVKGEPLVRLRGQDGKDRIFMGLSPQPFLNMRDEAGKPRLLAGISAINPYFNTRGPDGKILFHTP